MPLITGGWAKIVSVLVMISAEMNITKKRILTFIVDTFKESL